LQEVFTYVKIRDLSIFNKIIYVLFRISLLKLETGRK
jgi:hypothetical protein